MDAVTLKRVSKHMALLLRHAPEKAGLILDPEGFVPLDDLVAALRQTVPGVTADAVRAVVAQVEPHKQRYSIVDECVRANYGHSIEARIEHAPATPPDWLLHGTSKASVPRILDQGLRPMKRQYVHLTADAALALSVGARHGPPVLICVDARTANQDGIAFYPANRTFWLVDHVPSRYLRVDEHSGPRSV